MTHEYKPGDRVRLKVSIVEPCADDEPDRILATAGEELVVRRVYPLTDKYPLSIKHEHRTDDATFCVALNEVEPA